MNPSRSECSRRSSACSGSPPPTGCCAGVSGALPAALAAAAINVVSALIAMALGSAGALTGLAVSLVALVLTAVAAYTGQASHPHAQPADLSS